MTDVKDSSLSSRNDGTIESFETIDHWATVVTRDNSAKTLVLESPGLNGVRVRPGEKLCVGRSSKSQYSCPMDHSMSRRHFLIDYSIDVPIVEDLGSSNGTFVNTHRVSRSSLYEGDKIMAGLTVFNVHFDCDS